MRGRQPVDLHQHFFLFFSTLVGWSGRRATEGHRGGDGRGEGVVETKGCRNRRCPAFSGMSACPGKHFEVNGYATTFRGYNHEAWDTAWIGAVMTRSTELRLEGVVMEVMKPYSLPGSKQCCGESCCGIFMNETTQYFLSNLWS